ncbi:MAG: YfcE family phosphodiesterase [Chloroflexota bacterium]
MKLGLMADSHDDAVAIRRAVGIFNREGVALVLHAGDISSPQMALAFQYLHVPLIAICGNNDRDWHGLREAFARHGSVYSGYYETVLGGRRVALMHELRALHLLPADRNYDVVVYGHTHHFETRAGSYLLLNPGQCNLQFEGEATVAVLHLETLEVQKFVLVKGTDAAAEPAGEEHP